MSVLNEAALAHALEDLREERARQDAKFGDQSHLPDGCGIAFDFIQVREAKRRCEAAFSQGEGSWRHILDEEVHEAFAESDPAKLRAELVQVAAVAVAWIEAIDRRGAR